MTKPVDWRTAGMDYREAVAELYTEAALQTQSALCCTTSPVWSLPGLNPPQEMLDKNYGCGSTVHPRDLSRAERVLYVGVGAGLEVLQLAYFNRRKGGVVALDTNPAMLELADALLREAEKTNTWFERDMVDLREGDALELPIETESVDLVAQNCLFNIFQAQHLERALSEVHRVLRPRGAFVSSDPVAERPIPEHLAGDPRLRAQCLSGALPLDAYLQSFVDAGFGTLEVRARRAYRVLDPRRYQLDEPLMLQSVEVAAMKDPVPEDGPCIFTGRTAIYVGEEEYFDDDKGHVLMPDVPASVCDKTASALASLNRSDLYITEPTWHYAGDGCC